MVMLEANRVITVTLTFRALISDYLLLQVEFIITSMIESEENEFPPLPYAAWDTITSYHNELMND